MGNRERLTWGWAALFVLALLLTISDDVDDRRFGVLMMLLACQAFSLLRFTR